MKNLIRDFGQLFILAFDGYQFDRELADFFKTFRIGGVILFEDNFESPEQLTALIEEIQDKCRTDAGPLLISVDHEGGKIQRFRKGFSVLPPMSVVGEGTAEQTCELHRKTGLELREMGINLNFAPVADLCNADSNGSIGNRSFGDNPVLVSAHVKAAIRGLQENVLACVKHFPGHGGTFKSSHQELPEINITLDKLVERDLMPFRAAIEEGVCACMTAHIIYRNTGDAGLPATLSRFWLTDILRGEMGFEGLVITDSMEMKALTKHYPAADSGILALEAGADILLYYREKSQFQTFYEIRTAFERGKISPEKVSKSLERVREIKSRISN